MDSWIGIVFVLVSVFAYLATLLLSSYYYWRYLRGDNHGLLNWFLLVLFIFIMCYFLAITPIYNAIYNIVNELYGVEGQVIYYILYFLPVVVLSFRIMGSYLLGCRDRVDEKVNDIEYSICRTPVFNAWYNKHENRFYIGEPLYKVLSRDEIHAVMLHEKGHQRIGRGLSFVSSAGSMAWYYVTVTVILFLVFTIKLSKDLATIAFLTGFIIPFTPTITVIAMLSSWIIEHEADLNALRENKYDSIASALVKLHVYGSIEKYLEYVNEINLNPDTIKHPPKIDYLYILVKLLKLSWNAPFWYIELIKKPIYYTHPPLELRLSKLYNMKNHTDR